MSKVEMYKVVPLSIYSKCMEESEKKTTKEQLEELPKIAQKKAKRLLDFLEENGVSWDEHGILTKKPSELAESTDIIPLVQFAVRGKNKPSGWNNFAYFLGTLKIPKDILCTIAISDIKRSKKYASKTQSNN